MEVPCVRVLCEQVSENPSVRRQGRRAVCSNLETYPCVSDWSTFSNSLSLLLLCLASFHIAHSYIICLACLCVPHLCLTTRASYSTSTLIQRNQEELVQSPSPEYRLHSLVTLSVLQFSFNFRILFIRLVVHLFTPPLGVLTIGIRAYAPDIWFNHLGVWSWFG